MNWDFNFIKLKVRNLTGRPSVNQLSQADLEDYINSFYQYNLPEELAASELEDWYKFNTQANKADGYAVEEDYLILKKPFTIDGYSLNLYRNPSTYYGKYPTTSTYTATRPEAALLYNNAITFNPPPDKAYAFKSACIKRPAALMKDTDKPPNQTWGLIIAYGASINIKRNKGEDISEIYPIYEYYLNLAGRKKLNQLSTTRSIPRF
jgi:hypothetical protein